MVLKDENIIENMVLEDTNTQSQDEEIQLQEFIPQHLEERNLMGRGRTPNQNMILLLKHGT